jgi:hypothetical protein
LKSNLRAKPVFDGFQANTVVFLGFGAFVDDELGSEICSALRWGGTNVPIKDPSGSALPQRR